STFGERKIVDENSQEVLWNAVKHRYVQWNLTIDDGEVNRPPIRGHFLKVVCTSDTHGNLWQIMDRIPDGDVLIHAGDFTNFGTIDEIAEFNELMGRLPHPHKLVISGNHELGFDETEDLSIRRIKYRDNGTVFGYELLRNVTYLQDSFVEIDGLIFYGSPWHPLKGYPFYRPRNLIDQEWARFPPRIDVLITHIPPLGYMDLYQPVEHWGDFALLNRITDMRPRFHVFGHNHYWFGAQSNGPTTFMNVASKKGKGSDYNAPLVFYIATNRRR
ncbi:hypothetical protein PENTCL1PPCAC_21073, partial [Pristionchus entomophagus]